MNRNDILNSNQLKKRFVKDCNLPITLFDNPYFYERLMSLDILFDCVDKFDDFCLELGEFNSPEEYFNYYSQLMLSSFPEKHYGFIYLRIEDFAYLKTKHQ